VQLKNKIKIKRAREMLGRANSEHRKVSKGEKG
jgi:hypothetical protein